MKMLLPEAALAQHIAILGKSGAGKTTAAKSIIVEPLLAAGKRVAIVDPTSAWWGLRTSADGRGPGFKVLVLGGDHGDLPLPVHGGAAVARLIVEQGVNLVADTGNLTVGERTRWMIDFAGALYRLNRAPLHLVIDEAHVFAPQGKVPDPDTGRMLHAVNQIAAGGRSRGIRLTMLTQRPQKLHKDTLTTADTLIAMRVLAPQDREAVKAWVDGCGNPAQGKEVLDSLAQLQRGEGWVWYPEGGVLHRVRFPTITTFDSSATPKDGDAIATPRGAAEIDLTEIRAALADAAEEAAANDPKALRAQIAKLEREAHNAGVATIDPAEVDAAHRRGKIEGYAAALNALQPMVDRMQTLRTALDEQLGDLLGHLAKWRARHEDLGAESANRAQIIRQNVPAPAMPAPPRKVQFESGAGTNGALSKAERLILTALAQYFPRPRTKSQIALLTGYAVNGGGFGNAISSLVTRGYAVRGTSDIAITKEGMNALGSYERLPRGRALLAHWYGRLGKAERKSLEALAEAYPNTLSKAQVANRAGYEPSGGGFGNALSRLRTLDLIRGTAELKATPDLFD